MARKRITVILGRTKLLGQREDIEYYPVYLADTATRGNEMFLTVTRQIQNFFGEK